MKFIFLVLVAVSSIFQPPTQTKVKEAQKLWNRISEDWSRRARQARVDKSIKFDITITKPHDITSKLTLREPTQEQMHKEVVKLSNFVAKETAKTRWKSRDLIIQITSSLLPQCIFIQ